MTMYYLDNTNGSALDTHAGTNPALPWATFAHATTQLVAGDSVTVGPTGGAGGTYNVVVSPVNSGAVSNRITYQANPACTTRPKVREFATTDKSYITIDGFEVTNSGMGASSGGNFRVDGTTGIWITNNDIHDTTTTPVSNGQGGWAVADKCHWLKVSGNTVARCGSPFTGAGTGRVHFLTIWGDNCLVEDDDVSQTSDCYVLVGFRNVARNTTFHDCPESDTLDQEYHVDFIQCYRGGNSEVASYTLVENNHLYDNSGANAHFSNNNDNDATVLTTIIQRFNLIRDLGAYVWVHNNSNSTFNHGKVYNNTVVRALADISDEAHSNFNGGANHAFINNISVDSNTAPRRGYYEGTSFTGKNNCWYITSGSVSWTAPALTEPGSLRNVNPLFVSSTDFNLQATSPAKGSGAALTTVATADTGSGDLIVVDSRFFQDGWAGVDPDWIAVGTVTNIAQIVSINYATNTLTLDRALTRSDGQNVWLYKKSDGVRVLYEAQDMGAFPVVVADEEPPPPDPSTAILMAQGLQYGARR